MSSKKAGTNTGLYSVKDTSLVVAVGLGSHDHFSIPSLRTGKVPPHCHMPVINPVFSVILLVICLQTPMTPVEQSDEQFPPLRAHRHTHTLVPSVT